MLLKHKTAVIYGGGGAIGGAVARTLAREGATVFLAGRTRAKLDAVVRDITAAGGEAEGVVLDALDEAAVDGHADALASRVGHIDIVLNAVGITHVQGTPLHELSYDEFALPLRDYTRTNFLTMRAAARHMVKQGGGVIFSLSTPGSRMAGDGFLGYGAACAAIESMSRQLAGELGPHGVRTICLRADAIPEALAKGSHTREVFRKSADQAGLTPEEMLERFRRPATLLGRLPGLNEVAEVLAFMASDRASAVTACIANVSCGSVLDY